MCKDTFRKHWNRLVEFRKIMMSPDGRGWIPRVLSKTRRKSRIKLKSQIKLAEQFKQNLLRPWRKQLHEYYRRTERGYVDDFELPIESNPLFNKFKKYVRQGLDPYQLSLSIKETVSEYQKMRNDLRNDIQKLLHSCGFSRLRRGESPTPLEVDQSFPMSFYSGLVLEHTLYLATGKRDRDILKIPFGYSQDPEKQHRMNRRIKLAIQNPPLSDKAKEILLVNGELKNLVKKLDKALEDLIYHPGSF